MAAILTEIEARVLGVLIEKELTTPEYYPLSLNAMTNACNQKSNRYPVVNYDEREVVRAAESLRDKNLAMMVTGHGSRVAKYKHTFARRFQFNAAEVATLGILMLRGPQTVGEIRGRTGRLYDFSDLSEVENTLRGLMKRGEGAYVMELPKQPGRKEPRYGHLLCGEPELPPAEAFVDHRVGSTSQNDRMAALEQEVASLRQEVNELREAFASFRQEFE